MGSRLPHRLSQEISEALGDLYAPLELAAAGAAQVLGLEHGVTKALAKAAVTMDRVALWHARLAVKTLRRDQREAIAEVGE